MGKKIFITYDTQTINKNSKICNLCKGKGNIPIQQQMGPIVMQSISKCDQCKGLGYTNLYLPSHNTISVDIPKGFDYNSKMTIKNHGLPLYNGENGDLILSFNLKTNDKFKIKNKDLYISLDITLKESLTGFTKNIQHLDNRIITINSNSIVKPNAIKCIDNEGIFDINQTLYGNLYIKFKINFPDSLTEKQLKILNENF